RCGRRPDQHVRDVQRGDGRRLYDEGADRRHHGRRRQYARCVDRGLAAWNFRDCGGETGRPRPHHRSHLCAVPECPSVAADRSVREAGALSARPFAVGAAAAIVIAALAAFPLVASGYHLALAISLLYFTVLATAWALFS